MGFRQLSVSGAFLPAIPYAACRAPICSNAPVNACALAASLILTLRGLGRDGLVTRTVFPTVPPRVDYALTDLGRSLLSPISALGAWAYGHRDAIDAARLAFDARADAGAAPG